MELYSGYDRQVDNSTGRETKLVFFRVSGDSGKNRVGSRVVVTLQMNKSQSGNGLAFCFTERV